MPRAQKSQSNGQQTVVELQLNHHGIFSNSFVLVSRQNGYCRFSRTTLIARVTQNRPNTWGWTQSKSCQVVHSPLSKQTRFGCLRSFQFPSTWACGSSIRSWTNLQHATVYIYRFVRRTLHTNNTTYSRRQVAASSEGAQITNIHKAGFMRCSLATKLFPQVRVQPDVPPPQRLPPQSNVALCYMSEKCLSWRIVAVNNKCALFLFVRQHGCVSPGKTTPGTGLLFPGQVTSKKWPHRRMLTCSVASLFRSEEVHLELQIFQFPHLFEYLFVIGPRPRIFRSLVVNFLSSKMESWVSDWRWTFFSWTRIRLDFTLWGRVFSHLAQKGVGHKFCDLVQVVQLGIGQSSEISHNLQNILERKQERARRKLKGKS